MSAFRQEHRTLSLLITLGVLLGAGLALASPAGWHAPGRRAHGSPTSVVTPSPTAGGTLGAAATSGASRDSSRVGDARCVPVEPTPGWSDGNAPILRAIHALAIGCGRGEGLRTAVSRLVDGAGRANTHRSNGSNGSKGTNGSSGSKDSKGSKGTGPGPGGSSADRNAHASGRGGNGRGSEPADGGVGRSGVAAR